MGALTSRRLAPLAALGAGLLLASGCGLSPEKSGADDGGDASSISVWFPGANQVEMDLVNDKIVPAFEKKTGTDVKVTFVDWVDLSPKLNAAFAAGTAPDVFGHGPAAVADFVKHDRVEDLDPYVNRLDPSLRKDISTSLAGGQVAGKQYLMPLSVQGSLVVYDADAFTKAGLDPDKPPQTWEELRTAADKLTVHDGDTVKRAGLLVPSNPIAAQQTFSGLLTAAGGDILTRDGSKVAFDSPQGRKALDYFVNLYRGDRPVSNLLGEDYVNKPPTQQPIVKGDAAMALMMSPAMEQAVKAAPNKDLRVMPPLRFADSDKPAWLGGSGPGLMINKDSKAKKRAWEFINYMLEPDVSAQYTQGIGAIPLHASAADSAYVKTDPVIKAFIKAAPAFEPSPNVPNWVGMRDVIDAAITEALFGKSDSRTALAHAADKASTLLTDD
ncbi:ABC transporter substrate-binding protein [Streptomyces sp. NPDC004752]